MSADLTSEFESGRIGTVFSLIVLIILIIMIW